MLTKKSKAKCAENVRFEIKALDITLDEVKNILHRK